MANLGDFVSIPAQSSSTAFVPVPTPMASYGAPAVAAPVVGSGGYGSDGGILSAIILASILGNNNGLVGNGRGVATCVAEKDCATQASINALQDGMNTNHILNKLGSIEAAVPYNEAQVQLALAGLGDQLTRTITNGHTALTQNQFAMQLQEANSTAAVQSHIANSTSTLQNQLAGNTAAVLAGLNSVDTNVDRTGCAIINAVRDDGNATRALITENVIQGLRDDKVILANELAELRNERNRDRDRHGVEVTMINNQNQNQLQFQQQAQVLNTLQHGIIDALQSIRATNQAINIGAGTQVANPTNTNTNVRA
jgi:hypothetical protein